MGLIDTHCHLYYDYEGLTTDQLVEKCFAQGLEALVNICVERKAYDQAVDLALRYEKVYFSVGVHPHEAQEWDPANLDWMREAAANPKCVALGEMGNDYYYEHSPREPQLEILESQLNLAVELKKPVIIHSRDGEADLLPYLQRYAAKSSLGDRVGVIHCFSGTEDFAKACIDAGFLISLSGILTFKTAHAVRDVVKNLPVERIMVETDSPYLAPIPYRGKKAEPWMVKNTAEVAAELFGMDLPTFEAQTNKTARYFFGI